jgi:hypothetical protein
VRLSTFTSKGNPNMTITTRCTLLLVCTAMVAVLTPATSFAGWSLTSSVPLPTGAQDSSLASVSCATNCLSVGNYTSKSGAVTALAERWEKAWKLQEPALPKQAKASSFAAIACKSLVICVVVGSYVNGSGITVMAADAYEEGKWQSEEPPVPKQAKATSLSGVARTGGQEYIAVGSYTNSSGVKAPLAELHESRQMWKLYEPPAPKEAKSTNLLGVSCVEDNACYAVGSYLVSKTGTETLMAESFLRDEEWALLEPVVPKEAKGSRLSAMGCESEKRCTAVGEYVNGSGSEVPLAESWNEATWKIQEPAVPKGAKASRLMSVSCKSKECRSVGSYVNESGVELPLAEYWNGTTWTLQEPVGPKGAKGSFFAGVNCEGETCMAVGTAKESTGDSAFANIVEPAVTVTPATVKFGNSFEAQNSVIYTNDGPEQWPAPFLSYSVNEGSTKAVTTENGCSTKLTTGEKCTVTLKYKVAAPEKYHAELKLTSAPVVVVEAEA